MSSTAKKPGQPTQRYLDIAEIREDTVVMKDGTLRAVIMVSSINFALKSEDEQQAIIQGYMQFLNGLEHPLQVVVQSRKMNADGYLATLRQQEETIHNELLKTQIRDYTSFIKELVDLGQIMQKRFFVVMPQQAIWHLILRGPILACSMRLLATAVLLVAVCPMPAVAIVVPSTLNLVLLPMVVLQRRIKPRTLTLVILHIVVAQQLIPPM
jgi:hypothetical protein